MPRLLRHRGDGLDPPLVLVCVARTARARGRLHRVPFTVNVLGGAPRLENVLAWLECLPWRSYDGGDHTLFLGEVVDFGRHDGEPLAYLKSCFTAVDEPPGGHEYLL